MKLHIVHLLTLCTMPFEAFFSVAQLKPLLEHPEVEIVKFKLKVVRNPNTKQNEMVNIVCTGCKKHEFSSPEPVDIFPAPAKRKNQPGILGTVSENWHPSQVDTFAQQMVSADLLHFPGDPEFLRYGFVAFPKEDILQGIFKGNLTVPPKNPRKERTIGLVVRHMMVDLGVTVGRPGEECRKCISLYVMEKREFASLSIALAEPGDNPIKLRVGQPCPPDWWYTFEYQLAPGTTTGA